LFLHLAQRLAQHFNAGDTVVRKIESWSVHTRSSKLSYLSLHGAPPAPHPPGYQNWPPTATNSLTCTSSTT